MMKITKPQLHKRTKFKGKKKKKMKLNPHEIKNSNFFDDKAKEAIKQLVKF